MPLADIIQFFKECFLLDNRSPALGNIFSDKFEDLCLLEGKEQLLSDKLPYYPLETEYAEKVSKKLAVYKKEKSLYYGLYLLTGEDNSPGGADKKLCAPLFLFPATIVETDEGEYGIAVDKDKVLFNVRDLFRFKEQEQDVYSSYINKLPAAFWKEGPFMELCQLIKEAFPVIDVSSAIIYPQLSGEKEIRKTLHKTQLRKQEGPILRSAAFFAVLNNPKSFTGILDELEQLQANNDFSGALKAVLSGQLQEKAGMGAHRFLSPGNLSLPQQKTILNAHQYPLSMVVGPPGTGKSYTVANLAIDFLARGETVLIASKTDTAVDVIHTKIEEILDELLVSVRGGESGYKQKLRSHFSNLLAGGGVYKAREKELNPFKWSKELEKADDELEGLKKALSLKIDQEVLYGSTLQEKGLLAWLQKWKIRLEERYGNPLWNIANRLEELTEERALYARKYIQGRFLYHLMYTLKEHRQEISRFYQALRTNISGNKEELFAQINLPVILNALPIWLVNLNDISRILPLEKELFDLVIIDEASQCDISSCLPVLQRARKAVIVGDPKQLRHVSFLPGSAQDNIREKLKLGPELADRLNYRDNSILDLVSRNLQSQDQLSFLDEHFRSSPSLIRFSNQAFYSGSLAMMKDLPHHEKEALKFVKLKGRRTEKGVNEEEARQIMTKIQSIIDKESKLNARLSSKIGVLSPFREQTDFLAKCIQETLSGQAIEKHQILIGTAYGFQGEERDIMLLSFALDDQSHHSAFRHLEKHDVFNVSITRARNFQWVYYSFDCQKLSPNSLARQYITYETPGACRQPGLNEEEYEGEIEAYLQQQKLTYWKGYSLMGKQIDFLIKYRGQYLGLDLLGFQEEDVDNLPMERYQEFMRAGLQVFPLPYKNWLFRKEECKAAIKKALRKKKV